MAPASPLQLDDLSVLKEKVYDLVYEYFRLDIITGEAAAHKVSEAAMEIMRSYEPVPIAALIVGLSIMAVVIVLFRATVMILARMIIQIQ